MFHKTAEDPGYHLGCVIFRTSTLQGMNNDDINNKTSVFLELLNLLINIALR